MKNQELRSSLIKSGILLIVCIFFIYSFAASNSGGITGTISSLFSGILFIIGLTLALAVSVLVLFGIYFGILYMYNKDTCKDTYDEFKNKVTDFSKSFCGSCSTTCFSDDKKTVPANDETLDELKENQQRIRNQLLNLEGSLAHLENSLKSLSASVGANSNTIVSLDERTTTITTVLDDKITADALTESTQPLNNKVDAIQNSIKPLADKVASLENTLTSLNNADSDPTSELQSTVDTAINAIRAELVTMNTAIEKISSLSAEENLTGDSESGDDGPHRILTYFNKKSDEKQFISLVTEAVEKGMTYAQVGEFLSDSLSPDASEIIADHPSLTKDFIRICRQNKQG
ncbi:hypothetical protein UWK_03572 [Desulfocapsa sulfexigens DSM 10523]|uniref:Uncharacterized protein n=1 Tax=Desulfocapsa sulfexigens (strain DSM 10523 / SB164P1) TaxID=1167006 RepID=M1PUT1_DESSD|nr:hypothetical protein [Desulfocapsa sulfexigens]AGF80086.1 hypothetical protein UWK_03572 [Desulfocapsa sulfexigens DSM 10523]